MMKKIVNAGFQLLLVSFLFPFIANGQKLPNVQEASLRAPANIKVDGKATEWNDQFQAYNKATEIFYTLSNDNDKLYLTVQTTDLDIINKITCGGVALTINGSGKMKDDGGTAITFPILDRSTFPEYGPPINAPIPQTIDESEAGKKQLGDFILTFNKEITAKAKDIKVTGIKEITDTLISIYNPQGIKTIALVDDKRRFTYELAMPLKYLGLSVNDSKPVSYNIKLKGLNPDMNNLDAVTASIKKQKATITKEAYWVRQFGPSRPGVQLVSPEKIVLRFSKDNDMYYLFGPTAIRAVELINPTSFFGEYTLAK